MSETVTAERVRVSDPFASGMSDLARESERQLVPVTTQPGSATDQAEARIVTAQRVAVKRNIGAVTAEIEKLATAAGHSMFYSWEVEDRKAKRTTRIEGPSIDCAMTIVGAYGNCSIEAFPAKETQTHYTFMARFIDFEKGVTVTRSFQQRKGQNLGAGMDAGRAEDIVFQIGQSKAMRNAVVGALKVLADFAVECAKKGVVERIQKNPDAAREWLLQNFERLGINIVRVERIIGRVAARWSAYDMAGVFAEMQSIKDGYAQPDDVWPEVTPGTGVAGDGEGQEGTPKPATNKGAPVSGKPKADPGAKSGVAGKAPAASRPAEDQQQTSQPPANEPVSKPAPPAAQAGELPLGDSQPESTRPSQSAATPTASPDPDPQEMEEGDPEQADDPHETADEQPAEDEPDIEFN